MSENMNPLNDFLEMEENDNGMFSDLPFGAPVNQSVVQNAQTQPQADAVQPAAQALATQMPQQAAQPVQTVIPPQQPVMQAPQVVQQTMPQQA